jgi:class 3 adenylate cyclase
LPSRKAVRRTVTIVFCDLKGSTKLGERLDPEALHEVKDRYFAAMAAQITRHGGKIEKYIGDAIMAVFGLPVQHEDDALRAVRAAAGMQAALRTVNEELSAHYGVELAMRTGVNTGEVVRTTTPPRTISSPPATPSTLRHGSSRRRLRTRSTSAARPIAWCAMR